MPRGFISVDIFYVISGYIILGIILKHIGIPNSHISISTAAEAEQFSLR